MGLIRSNPASLASPVLPAAAGINTAGATIGGSLQAAGISTAVQAEIESLAIGIADQREINNDPLRSNSNGRVFTRFDLRSDVVGNQKTIVTTGLFSGNAATMSVMFTSSLQTDSSKNYYYEAWNGTSTSSEPQFSIAYGNRLGSGSSAAGTLNDSPSRAIYSQYRLLLLEPGDTTFTTGLGDTDSIFALNFNRARIKDKLDPGNWQLTIGELDGAAVANNVHTGSNVKIKTSSPKFFSLIDDSGQTQETNLTSAGRVSNIVSGSITSGIFNSTNPVYFGLCYPDMGILILDGNMLNASASFNIVSGSNIAGDNAWKLFTSVSGAMANNSINNAFQARNAETVTSTHYFVRVKNAEYNFSNNPSFVTGSVGEFVQPTFIGDPKVYITSIGLYNDRQELLAVAKLSQPVQKSFSKEALIKVKLDF